MYQAPSILGAPRTSKMNPTFGDKLLSHLHALYKTGGLCDVVLTVEGYLEYKAHRVVLSAFSSFFHSLFDVSRDLRSTSTQSINIPDIPCEIFSQVLLFMYTGQIEVNSDNVWNIMAAATQLEIPTMLELCQNYMKVNSASTEQDCKDDPTTMALIEMVQQMPTHVARNSLSSEFFPEREKASKGKQGGQKWKKIPRRKTSSKLDFQTGASDIKLEQLEDIQDIQPDCSNGEDDEAHENAGPSVPVESPRRRPGPIKLAGGSLEQSQCETKACVKKTNTDSESNRTDLPMPRKRGRPRKNDPITPRGPKKTPRTILRKSPTLENLHKCHQCSETFLLFSSLQLHEKTHNPLKKTFLKSILWKYALNGLKTAHTRNEPVRCNFGTCKRVFKLYSSYRGHFIKTHCSAHRCIRCKTYTRVQLSQLRHNMKEHPTLFSISTRGLISCRCGRRFAHQRNLKRHKKLHQCHKKCSALKCQQCGRQFMYVKSLKLHTKAHTDISEVLEARCSRRKKAYKMEKNLSLSRKGQMGNPLLRLTENPDKKIDYPYKCPVCAKSYSTTMHLKLHMSSIHKLPVTKASILRGYRSPQWKCQEEGCTEKYHTHMELKAHMLSDHPAVMFHCPTENCRYRTPVHTMMAKHTKNNHNPDKRCNLCGKDFRKTYFLRVHQYAKHDIKDARVRVHKCPKEGCSYETFQRNILDHHIWRHNTDKLFTCDTCGKKLKTEQNLKKHINKIHLKIRPYVCDQCGADYGELAELKMHLVRHNKEKRFKCEHCEYETHDKGNYKGHVWAKHKIAIGKKKKAFVCNVCDYSCVHKARFDEHMNSHMGIRPHKCTHCEKEFLSRSTMKAHIKWKHMEKAFHCDHCEYRCNTVNFLREHVRVQHTHRDIKPYKCAYCDYVCAVSGNCRKHIANRHKGLPIKWEKVCDKWGPKKDRPILGVDHLVSSGKIYNMNTFNQSIDRLIAGSDERQKTSNIPSIVCVAPTQNSIATSDESLISSLPNTTVVGFVTKTESIVSNAISDQLDPVHSVVEVVIPEASVNQQDIALSSADPNSSQLVYNVYQPEPVVVQGQHDYSQTVSFYPIP